MLHLSLTLALHAARVGANDQEFRDCLLQERHPTDVNSTRLNRRQRRLAPVERKAGLSPSRLYEFHPVQISVEQWLSVAIGALLDDPRLLEFGLLLNVDTVIECVPFHGEA